MCEANALCFSYLQTRTNELQWCRENGVDKDEKVMRIDRVFVQAEAQRSALVGRFCAALAHADVVIVNSEAEVRQHLHGPDKRAIYIGPRSSKFVSRFHPPHGMVCATFWKFTSETECLYGCHYCYLALTMRIIPYLRVASNLDDGVRELEAALQSEAAADRRAMFNIGELADGRLLDPITEFSRAVVPMLHHYPNGMLHVLTKSGIATISNYLELAHLARKRVIQVASINPQSIIDLTEDGTPPVIDRLNALRELQKAGYRIRLRIDPIFDLRELSPGSSLREAFGVYDELVTLVRRRISPEMVTLGSYRPNPQLIPHIRRRYPESPVLQLETHKEGAKRRITGRETFYAHIAERLQAAFSSVHVALCKETPTTWRKAELEMKPLQCSCLPLVEERRLQPCLPALPKIPIPKPIAAA